MDVTSSLAACVFLLVAPESTPFHFCQAAPLGQPGDAIQRRTPITRAVVLIHGLQPHPFNSTSPTRPAFSGWERHDSTLVKALADDSDVFAVGYAQTRPVDEIAESPALCGLIDALHAAGYKEVVLVGHSAGGLIARYYVENRQGGGGVTKVIQMCSPNDGSSWARLTPGVRASQERFLASLTRAGRQESAVGRAGRIVPANVEMVCVVSTFVAAGDGVVRADSQWPPDLQAQGVRAVAVGVLHSSVPFSKSVAKVVAELVREPQPRWDAAATATARTKVLGLKEQ